MAQDLNRGGVWPAVKEEQAAGNVIVADFRQHRPRQYPNVEGMPERATSIPFGALVTAIIASGAVIAAVGVVASTYGTDISARALTLLWVATCGAAVRWATHR